MLGLTCTLHTLLYMHKCVYSWKITNDNLWYNWRLIYCFIADSKWQTIPEYHPLFMLHCVELKLKIVCRMKGQKCLHLFMVSITKKQETYNDAHSFWMWNFMKKTWGRKNKKNARTTNVENCVQLLNISF